MDNTVNMSVSPICVKEGKKYAFVTFLDGERQAEGKIPDCRIIANKGFSLEEVTQLEEYMQRELPNLKQMAAGIHLLDALIK